MAEGLLRQVSRVGKRAKATPAWTPQAGPQSDFYHSDVYEILYGGAAGGGKRLRVDEPIPTPSGWTTMGELRVGDVVFDADGQPTRVTWCSEVEENPDAWELIFDDGSRIECDAEHQWVTLTDKDRAAQAHRTPEWRAVRRASRPRRIGGLKSERFTAAISARNSAQVKITVAAPPRRGFARHSQEIVDSLRVGRSQRANHCILNADPLSLPEGALQVDPYVLGAWLGDGHSAAGVITGLDREVWENVEAAGFKVVHRRTDPAAHAVHGLVPLLRALGVLKNKHVPQQYLRSSAEQRLALLQGLCDTDGHATAKGSVEFTTTSQPIRDGIVELLYSLGIKPSCREGRATLRGRDISAKWRIQFWTAHPCFRIARKLARQKRSGFRGCHDRRYIIAARRVAPTPMRCIGVDSPSRTYLAGRQMVPTHNSAALVAYPLRWAHIPESRSLILRRNTPQLEDLLEKARQIYKTGKEGRFRGFDADAEFRGDKGVYTFKSGAKVRFGHCNDTNDWLNYQGHEYQCIGFDELTHYTERQYLEICSRCRGGSARTPKVIRSTTNPGGPGHGWVFKRWKYWLDPDATIPGRSPRLSAEGAKLPPARPGEVLWFFTEKDGTERLVEPGMPEARSRTFIPAKLEDNKALLEDDPGYRQRLRDNDPVRRKQLEDGNWLVKPAAGLYFRRDMFTFVDDLPIVAKWVRAWDFGATPENGSNDPDWTRGLKIGKAPDGSLWIADLASLRGAPGEVEGFLKATAEIDGKSVIVRMPQDPAAAGKIVAAYYARLLLGWPVSIKPVTGDKIVRAKVAQGQAQVGNIRIKRAPWNEVLLAELESFPEGDHDDIVDTLSDGVDELGIATGASAARSGGHREFGGSNTGNALERAERNYGGGRGGF